IFVLVAQMLTWRTRSAGNRPAQREAEAELATVAASRRHKLLWVLLPMGAAMQLSAVTSYLTQNIAAIPLLWILPLAVYLITIIVAFQFPHFLPRGILVRFVVVLLAGLGYMLSQVDVSVPLRIALAFFLIEVFFSCLFL